MLSIEKLLFEQIEFMKNQLEIAHNQNEWLREMLSRLSPTKEVSMKEIDEEDMVPINRIELPSERRSRLSKKFADLKREMNRKESQDNVIEN